MVINWTNKGLGFWIGSDISKLVTMEEDGGGRFTPSYNNVVSNRSKEASLNNFQKPTMARQRKNGTQKLESNKSLEKEGIHEEIRREMKSGDSGQRTKNISTTGPCKPKKNIKPWVVLNDPTLQVHKDQMATYVVIRKFMGIWPMEKALYTWIRNNWKPNREINLHLGSKGFFTVVFTNLEDKDIVFEGGPYFYAVTGLYMRPWVMNFFPKWETFTSVPVWIRLYSLP